MNVLLLDQTASFLDFALRCHKAGHYPRLCIARDKETKKRSLVGDGLVEKIEGEEWQRHMNWADLVICSDNVKWLKELDVYRKKGYPVFAPSYESAQLELDRGKGQALFRKAGIKVGDYEVFSDYAKAKKYVMQEMKRFVSKPMGDKDKALSYVSKSVKDMVYTLGRWSERNKDPGPFLLQEHVEGIEFAVAGWMGPKGFTSYFEENFEYKKLMPEDYGPNTGEMGTVLKYTNNSQLAREVLLPLEGELIRMGHRGSIDVDVIIDKEGNPMPLEFTCRPGWPSFNIVQPLHMECCEWMANLVDGKDTFEAAPDVAVGVVMALHPFPWPKYPKEEVEGFPIYGLDDDNPYREYIAPCEVIVGQAPVEIDGGIDEKGRVMVSCGDYVAVATGCAMGIKEAKDNAYKAVKSLEIPGNVVVRSDIGDGLKQEIPKLQDYGFAMDWTW